MSTEIAAFSKSCHVTSAFGRSGTILHSHEGSFSRKAAARHGGIYQTYLPDSGVIASLVVAP